MLPHGPPRQTSLWCPPTFATSYKVPPLQRHVLLRKHETSSHHQITPGSKTSRHWLILSYHNRFLMARLWRWPINSMLLDTLSRRHHSSLQFCPYTHCSIFSWSRNQCNDSGLHGNQLHASNHLWHQIRMFHKTFNSSHPYRQFIWNLYLHEWQRYPTYKTHRETLSLCENFQTELMGQYAFPCRWWVQHCRSWDQEHYSSHSQLQIVNRWSPCVRQSNQLLTLHWLKGGVSRSLCSAHTDYYDYLIATQLPLLASFPSNWWHTSGLPWLWSEDNGGLPFRPSTVKQVLTSFWRSKVLTVLQESSSFETTAFILD